MRRLPLCSRRSALAQLAAIWALPTVGGCIASAGHARALDLDHLDPSLVFVIGRVRLQMGVDITGSATLETTSTPSGGYLLDGTGEVLWTVPRSDVATRVTFVTIPSREGALTLNDGGPEIAPPRSPEPIVYFGEVVIDLARFAGAPDDSGAKIEHSRRDDADSHLPALAATMHKLMGRRYFHLMRGRVEQVSRRGPASTTV